jgi:hypothetical protein
LCASTSCLMGFVWASGYLGQGLHRAPGPHGQTHEARRNSRPCGLLWRRGRPGRGMTPQLVVHMFSESLLCTCIKLQQKSLESSRCRRRRCCASVGQCPSPPCTGASMQADLLLYTEELWAIPHSHVGRTWAQGMGKGEAGWW